MQNRPCVSDASAAARYLKQPFGGPHVEVDVVRMLLQSLSQELFALGPIAAAKIPTRGLRLHVRIFGLESPHRVEAFRRLGQIAGLRVDASDARIIARLLLAAGGLIEEKLAVLLVTGEVVNAAYCNQVGRALVGQPFRFRQSREAGFA